MKGDHASRNIVKELRFQSLVNHCKLFAVVRVCGQIRTAYLKEIFIDTVSWCYLSALSTCALITDLVSP